MKKLFEPTTLGTLKMKNRLIRSATWEGLADERGHMKEELFERCETLADGGIAAIISGFTSVSGDDHCFGGIARLSSDDFIGEHKRLTDIAHRRGCPIIVQLALGEYNGAYRDMSVNDLSEKDIRRIRDMFADGAVRAAKAGYDGVQIHAAHNFFLSRFISPGYNRRTDRYGRTPEGRAALIIEILHAIKTRCPELHVSMKINCSDFFSGGLTPAESLRICELCAENRMDSIEVSGNGTSVPHIKAGENEGYFKDFALRLGERTDLPIILVGGHRSIGKMEQILNEGRVDFLSLSRPLLREPALPNRWKSGDTAPAKCVSCNRCYQTPGHRCVFSRASETPGGGME